MSRMLDEIRRAIKSGHKTCYRLSKETGIPKPTVKVNDGRERLEL
jgi:hypothetical protein